MAAGPGAGAGAGGARKYDRQLRVWGAEGQERLARARVGVLGLGPAGAEAAKNLALGGVAHLTLVDGRVCSAEDLGNNFFCDQAGLGQPRAAVCCRLLRELNPEVGMAYVEADPAGPDLARPEFLRDLALVVAAGLPRPALAALDTACRAQGTALIAVDCVGLAGTVRLSVQEHCVWDARPDTPAPDLRLDRPWPELEAHCATAALPGDPESMRALPWAALVLRAASAWRAANEGRAPRRADAAAFREQLPFLAGGSAAPSSPGPSSDAAVAAAVAEEPENLREARANCHRVWAPLAACPPELAALLADDEVEAVLAGSPPGSGDTQSSEPPASGSENENFWVLAGALRLFRDRTGELPLEGSLPDMAATTDQYVALQRVYASKAAADASAVMALVQELLALRGRDPSEISPATVARFCRNSRGLQVARYPPIRPPADAAPSGPSASPATPDSSEKEEKQADGDALRALLRAEDTLAPASLYVALQAAEAFVRRHGRHPGCFQGGAEASGGDASAADLEEDVALLKQLVGADAEGLQEDYLQEVVRAGGTQLHTAGALLGGIVAQEAIKLLTLTFVPQRGTLVWDGIACGTRLLELA